MINIPNICISSLADIKTYEKTMDLRWMNGILQQKYKVEKYLPEERKMEYYDEWIAVPTEQM